MVSSTRRAKGKDIQHRIEKFVRNWFENKKNKSIYASDVAMALKVDYAIVRKKFNKMVKKKILNPKQVKGKSKPTPRGTRCKNCGCMECDCISREYCLCETCKCAEV